MYINYLTINLNSILILFSVKVGKTNYLIPQKQKYKKLKNIPKFEEYLDDIKNIKYLNALTKLRLSDHKLMIEEGRRKRPIIPREGRICKTCNKIEDEIRFLIDCDKYKDDGMDKFKIIINEVPCFEDMPDSKTKFIYLMSHENK